jgi:hypothetical protein
MKSDKRNLIFFGTFVLFYSIFYFFVLQPTYLWWAYGASIISALAITILQIRSGSIKQSFLPYLIFPLVAISALFSASTLPVDLNLVYVLGASVVFLLAYYFKLCYLFIIRPTNYKIGTLENFSVYANLIIFYLSAYSLFGFMAYLSISIWLKFVLLVGFSSLIFYQFFWSHKFEFKHFATQLAVGVLLITEIAYALTYLPFDFMSTATILTATFYCLANLQKLELQAKLTPAKIKHYLAFIFVCFVLIYLSAQWL